MNTSTSSGGEDSIGGGRGSGNHATRGETSQQQQQQQQYYFDHSPETTKQQMSPSSFADIPDTDHHRHFGLHSPYDDGEPDTSYEIFSDSEYNDNSSRPIRSLRSIRSIKSQQQESTTTTNITTTYTGPAIGALNTANTATSARFSRTFSEGRNYYEKRGDRLHQYYNERANRIFSETSHQPASSSVPLMEVSAEILAVRKSALRVYLPLTYTWLIFSPGLTITVALGMAKWTGLLHNLPYWIILSPCWLSHACLLASHIYATKALSIFISQANTNRQRSDSTDHIDRTEYLPLLQRSLKFGMKTGAISLAMFLFEILLFVRLSFGRMNMAVVLTPLWIIVLGGILDGIICKTQHVIRVFSWTLLFSFMMLLVIRVDHNVYALTWSIVFAPLVILLGIVIAALLYIIQGHHVGYYRLTDSQYAAGFLYIVATCLAIVLTVTFLMADLMRPTVLQTILFMELLAPLGVALFCLGAYAVSRDEFERLLQYGGQAAVHPKRLVLGKAGWTVVESDGVMWMPMFGEVQYEPLDCRLRSKYLELCPCCACYPYEEEEEILVGSGLESSQRTLT